MARPMYQEDEQDMYVTQLKEVFDSCDNSNQGYLKATELQELCNKLQLEEQAPNLIQQLLSNDQEARIGFEEFKEGFVAVLSETVDDIGISDDEESGCQNEGRQSENCRQKSETEVEIGDGDSEMSSTSLPSYFKEASHKNPQQVGIGDTKCPSKDMNCPGDSLHQKIDPTTFEAEGQMNQSISDMEKALDPVSEEEHLKAIWKELRVGKDGYLSMEELSIVCEHIGMDEMNNEELLHLFEKLDVDGDGGVSFQEFLLGLFQHGGSTTPRTPTTPVRPLSTPKQKLRINLSKDTEERTNTPSLFLSGSGLFSAMDTDNTGYVKADVLIDFWEAFGVTQGVEILEYLQFDLNSKINLTDLSHALEQELRGVEDDNATYQAALVSYECELRHIKTQNDQLFGEREKLKADLIEANQRIAILIKEGDDRVTAVERSKEKELGVVEKKFMEQIKALQSEIDEEREIFLSQSSKQRKTLEGEIASLKEEEFKLREKLAHSQKEIERMEQDLVEIGDRFDEVEKQNMRQAKELRSFVDLQKKLEEIEATRENILDEQEKFSNTKLQELEYDNIELKDKNDELTIELEELRQQLTSNRRAKRGPRERDCAHPQRTGSVLSNYSKPHVMIQQNNSDSVSESNSADEDLALSTSSRRRRQLPPMPSDASDIDTDTPENDEIPNEHTQKEIQFLKDNHKIEITELESAHSMDKSNIEKKYLKAIAELEVSGRKKLDILEEKHNFEKKNLEKTWKESLDAEVFLKECDLKRKFQQEKEELLAKVDSEKQNFQQEFNKEKADLVLQLREEFNKELEEKLQTQRNDFTKQLEATVTKDKSDYFDVMQQQKQEMEIQLQNVRAEVERETCLKIKLLEDDFAKEKLQMVEKHQKLLDESMDISSRINSNRDLSMEIDQIKEDHKNKCNEYELRLQESEQRLMAEKDQFHITLEKEKAKIMRGNEKERSELIKDYEREKTMISQTLTKEKMELEKKYQNKIDDIENKLIIEREVILKERDELHRSMTQEKRSWERDRDIVKEEMEEEIMQEFQSRLEEEFLSQIDQLKEAFNQERFELESKIDMLQREIDDMESHQADYNSCSTELKLVQEKRYLGLEKEQEENRLLKEELSELSEAHKKHASQNFEGNLTLLQTKSNQTAVSCMHESVELREQLENTSVQLAEAYSQLAIIKSQHQREKETLSEKFSSMVEMAKYNKLNEDLIQTQQKVTDLEVAMEKRSSETTKLILGTQQKHSLSEQKLSEECKELKRNLEGTKELLQDQIKKYNNQLIRSTKGDLLIKDLYVENSNLMKCLELTEKREKDAERRVYTLEDKCLALCRLLRKVAPVALGY